MTTILPGYLGVDYSAARIPSDTLLAARVRFVCRYSSRNPNQKNLDGNETADLLPAGIGISLNHEQTTGGMLGSPAEVVDMARVAVSNAHAHGYPPGIPISFSHDTAPKAADRALVVSNYRLVTSVLADAGYPCGAYGGLDFIDWLDQEGLCTELRWQSYAWSTVNGPRWGSADSRNRQAKEFAAQRYPGWPVEISPNETGVAIIFHPTAHVFQQYGRVFVPTSAVPQSIDENICRRPFRVWSLNEGPDPVPPVHQENPVLKFVMFPERPGDVFLADWHTQPNGAEVIRTVTPASFDDIAAYTATGGFPDETPAAPGYTNVRMLDSGAWAHARVIDGPVVGAQGPIGPAGPKGDPGPAGQTPVLNRAAIVAALQKD